jgi:hypothetical protein
MKTIASTSTLLLVCVGCGALSLGFGSCDGSSSGGEGGTVQEAGQADTGTPRDAAMSVDTGSVLDTGTPDTATASPDSGGDEAGSCGEPHTGLGATCNACLQTNCEPTWCACATGPADLDAGDAGSGCLQYVQCVEGCVAGDAGSPTDCLTTVCAVAPFTTPQQQAGHAFLDCLVQYCGSDCGQ